MYFPESTTDHESDWEIQLFISEILGHHIHRRPRILHVKLFISVHLQKKLIFFLSFYINLTGWVEIRVYYCSETFFIISLEESIAL